MLKTSFYIVVTLKFFPPLGATLKFYPPLGATLKFFWGNPQVLPRGENLKVDPHNAATGNPQI